MATGMKRIALVGDYDATKVAHRAIPIALKWAVDELRADVTFEWLPSRELRPAAQVRLEPYAALWCVPGSPYQNTQGVIDAIRFARVQSRPFLGTCGGFQHALLEYAQAVWGIDAQHAETNPKADDPLIAPLVCSLVEVRGGLNFEPGSRLRAIYGRDSASEEYHCNFGLNPSYASRLQKRTAQSGRARRRRQRACSGARCASLLHRYAVPARARGASRSSAPFGAGVRARRRGGLTKGWCGRQRRRYV
jgi:CTP synthase (UTP-ammonia lyase)